MTRYLVVQLDEIDEISDGRCPSRPVRLHFGITSFGVNAWTGRQAGDRIINEHDEAQEDGEEELYLVQSGRARFELDGESVQAPAGTLIFAPPGVKRTAFAAVPGTTILVIGGTPGRAYEPSGYEIWAPLSPLYEADEFAQAAARGRELLKAHPEYPGLMYNVACCESLAGEAAEAIEHLRRAVEGSDRSAWLAAGVRTSIRFVMIPRSRSWSIRVGGPTVSTRRSPLLERATLRKDGAGMSRWGPGCSP